MLCGQLRLPTSGKSWKEVRTPGIQRSPVPGHPLDKGTGCQYRAIRALGTAGSGQWQRGNGTLIPGHPALLLPYLDQADHLQALCVIPQGLQFLEDSVNHLWTSWLVPRTPGWISPPPQWAQGLLGDPGAQHCTAVLSPLPATCPLCPHLPDDTLEGQLCPRATGVPQQQGHAVAKGNQGQLGSCQLQDLLLVGETNPAGQGQPGTAMAATAGHSQHGADGPGSCGWGQATQKDLGLLVPVLHPSGKHHQQSGSSPGVREGDNVHLSPIPA